MISESACLPRSRWKTLLTVLRLTSGGKRDWKSRGSTSPSANSGSNLATNKPHSCLQIELKHRETLKRESSLFFCWLLPRWLRGYSPRQLVRHLWDVPQCRNRPGESGPAKWWVHMSVIAHTHTHLHINTHRDLLWYLLTLRIDIRGRSLETPLSGHCPPVAVHPGLDVYMHFKMNASYRILKAISVTRLTWPLTSGSPHVNAQKVLACAK